MTVEHHPEPDGEAVAAQRLLRACVALLASQREAQPGAFEAINAAAQSLDLCLTVTLSHAPRGAVVRLALIDPTGAEAMLVRRLELAPPLNVPAPRAVQ